MDNIKKTVVIVLGISAILALVVPSQVNSPVAKPVAEGGPGPKPATEAREDGENNEAPQPDEPSDADQTGFDDEGTGEEFGGFGEPTIDGDPFDEFATPFGGDPDSDRGDSNEGGGAVSESVPSLGPRSVPAGAPPPRHAGRPAPAS